MTQTQDRNSQTWSAALGPDTQPTADFDQWASAVRQQMVAALKRRGNS
ncbi:MAG TPA: hypothetical protein VLS96_13180 [Nodosilinea sp.]|nr:hypothetical protein [Nodosilinea sp.]